MQEDYQILTKYMTESMLEELLETWLGTYKDSEEVEQIRKAIASLKGEI